MWEKDNIKQLLMDYITAGLVESNMEKVLSCVTDEVIGFGMGEQGFVADKKDIRRIMEETIKENPDAHYQVHVEDVVINMHCDTVASLCAKIIVECTIDGQTSKSGLMQSLTVKKVCDKWLITALHASPMMLSEESIDAYPLQFVEKTLAQLRAELQTQAFGLINHSIPGGMLSIRQTNGRYSLYFVNESMLSYLGYPYEEFMNLYESNMLEMIHPEDRKRADAIFQNMFQTGQDCEGRFRIQKKDGSILWMAGRGRRSTDDEDRNILLLLFLDVTDMVLLQQELEEQTRALSISEERFRIALQKTTNIIFDYDLISGNIMHSSAPKKSPDFVTNIENASNTLIIGGTVMPESMDVFMKAFEDMQKGVGQSDCVVKVRMASGKQAWNRISMTAMEDEKGRAVRAIGMIEDITRQKEVELAYAREEQYRQVILSDAMAYYVINFSRDYYESCEIMDSRCVQINAGDSYSNIIHETTKSSMSEKDRIAYLDNFSITHVLQAFEKGEREIKLEYRSFMEDGTDMWMQSILRLVVDGATNEKKGFLYVTDIDERKQREFSLTQKAQRDSLTALYNKAAAGDKIRELLKTSEAIQSGVFMMIDVDNFKAVNDQYGHPFGDKVLVDAAHGILDILGEADIVGRLGGDEFCVFFSGVAGIHQVKELGEEICRIFRGLFKPPKGKIGPSCSIGIALCNGQPKTFEQLYQEADEALYRAKNTGRNRYEFSE